MARVTPEIAAEAKEVTESYVALRDRKPTYADDVRARMEPLREKILSGGARPELSREFQWLLTSLDYADHRLPRGNGRVLPKNLALANRLIQAANRDFSQLIQGTNPFPRKRGQLLKSYYSPLDGSWQTYGVAVPSDYRGDRPYPLMVQLHGHGGYRAFQGFPPFVVGGIIIAAPQGRGSADYMLAAEEDVLRVIDEVRKDYRIDPDRVILEGHSMGGTGSWNLGVKYPDRFSCIAPVMGNADREAFYLDRPRPPAPSEPLRGLWEFLLAVNDPVTWAENLSNLPIHCGHGARDSIVRVQHSRRMVERLRGLGLQPVYQEFEDVHHGGFSKSFYDERWQWMLRQRRNPKPSVVHYRTARLRHAGAYWVRIDLFERWGQLAEVRAEQTPAGDLVVQTQNVAAFSILPERLPKRPEEALNIQVNDQRAYGGGILAEIALRKTDGRWVHGDRPAGLTKKRGLEGPVDDAMLDPFLIVYGTISGDPLWNRITKAEAEQLAAEWERRYLVRPRIKPDVEIREDDLEQYNLFLYGGAEQNAVSARVCASLPIRLTPEGVRAGDALFTGEGLGVKFCYPNPLNVDRYVVLIAAQKPLGLWQVNNRFGNFTGWVPLDNWDWFDYAVFDDRTRGPDTMLCTGFFGPKWDLVRETQWRGDPERRRAGGARRLPALTSLALELEPPAALSLSHLLPVRIAQGKGTVSFDRSYQGNALRIGAKRHERGFGVRVPSELEFSLRGNFRRLRFDYGVDLEGQTEVTGERAKTEWLKFSVLADRRRLWSSEWVNWRSAPPSVEIEIEGVDLLCLKVEGGGSQWLYGSAAWGSPTVSR